MNKEHFMTLAEGQTFDVSELTRFQRIIFNPEDRRMCMRSSRENALKVASRNKGFEILSRDKAANKYPEVFTSSVTRGRPREEDVSCAICFRMSDDMKLFLLKKGDMSKYLRKLIQAEMDKSQQNNTTTR